MVRMIVEFRREIFEFNLTGRSGKQGVSWKSIKEATENRIKLIRQTAQASGKAEQIKESLAKAEEDFGVINEKVKERAPKLFVGKLVRELNKALREIEESINA